MNEIEKKVKEVIAKKLEKKIEEIPLKASLVNDLGADSLDIVEIVLNLEDVFKCQISEDAAKNIKTVEDIVQYAQNIKK